jgi:Cys-rich peptide (TIGR04165 family)
MDKFRMKAEELDQKCPKCGSREKTISTVKNPVNKEKLKEASITDETNSSVIIGSIRCSGCRYLFEYCKNGNCTIEVKKLELK